MRQTAPAPADPLIVGIVLVAIGALYALMVLIALLVLHRPLLARRVSGTHAPTHAPMPGEMRAAPRVARDVAAASTSAPSSGHGPPAGTDTEVWRPVEYEVPEVGLIRLDARTVRTFAGHPEVLRRLAFQRWRCSEFGVRERAPHEDGTAREAGADRRQVRTQGGQGSQDGLSGGSRLPTPLRAEAPPGLDDGATISYPTVGGDARS